MSALTNIAQLSYTSSSSSTNTSPSLDLPGRALLVVEIENSNSPAVGAPQGAPTIGGTNGLTWTQATSLHQGGGSPTVRLSTFVAMSPTTLTAKTIVATWGASQLSSMKVLWVGGLDASGSDGVNAFALPTFDAASASAGSLSIPGISGLGSRDSLLSAFATNSGTLDPQPGHTEISDDATNGTLELQYHAGPVADAGASRPFGSSYMIGTALRLKAASPGASVIQEVVVFNGTSSGAVPFNFFATKGRVYILFCEAAAINFGGGALSSGVISSWTDILSMTSAGPGNTRMWAGIGIASDDGFVSGVVPMIGTACAVVLLEIDCDTVNYPTGYRQIQTFQQLSSGGPYALLRQFSFGSALLNENSTVLIIGTTYSAAPTAQPGWIQGEAVPGAVNARAIRRHNAFQPEFSGANGGSAIVALEFIGPPIPHAPVITLVSPAPGAISHTASITIDVTDQDGNLSSFAPIFTFATGSPELAHDGAAFTGPYAASSTRSVITDGFRYVFTRTGGWPSVPLDFNGTALDTDGLITTSHKTWTTDFVAPVAPVIALVSPAPGAISHLASIVIDVTDVNGDLLSFVPTFTLGAAAPEVAGDISTFTSPYSGSSRSVITNGFRYTFVRTGGWTDAALAFDGTAFDAGGLSSTLHRAWTTDFSVPSTNPPVVTVVSPAPGTLGRHVPIVIDVTDPDGDLDNVFPFVTMAGATELAHNWATGLFLGPYVASSTRTVIADGYRYTFDRGGWAGGTISVFVIAADAAANETQATFVWSLEVSAPPASGGDVAAPIVDVADVALDWSDGGIDTFIRGDDIAFDRGLRTAVLLSLFTDRRAEDDALPADDGDRRGWWADQFLPIEGDRMGSRLWLLDRSARRGDVAQRAEEMIREALAWMLEDRVVKSIDVAVEIGTKELFFSVTLHRPGKDPVPFRFSHVWDHVLDDGT